MDYIAKDLLPEDSISEVREPVATYAASGRAAAEPWAANTSDEEQAAAVRNSTVSPQTEADQEANVACSLKKINKRYGTVLKRLSE
jgi:pyruvate/2-oxoglutarate dehydrogenase complex dihydrolipoamide acyltransferase (E2) component